MAKKVLNQSINLLEPIESPEDSWSKVYDWVFKVGRYILIAVEGVVLLVFLSRFVLDWKNNDLTEDVNALVDELSQPTYRSQEILFSSVHGVMRDISVIDEETKLNSNEIKTILDSIPKTVTLVNFTYSDNAVGLSLTVDSFEKAKDFEKTLSLNPRYEEVVVNLEKSGEDSSEITMNVSFSIIQQ